MDPTDNPFAPGAGTRPPELAGRDGILENARVALVRTMKGRAAKGQMVLGLRGVGKTVLLNRIAEFAEDAGCTQVMLEAPEDKPLAEMLVPPLRKLLFGLSRKAKARDLATRGLAVLRSFASGFQLKVGDVEFSVAPETGTGDSGNLEADLPEVLRAATEAVKGSGSALVLLIDEVQYLEDSELAALIVAAHKLSQRGLPFILFGAGLPQLAGLAGEAKSYAERLFDYPEVGPLPHEAARAAIAAPLEAEGVAITEEALETIVEQTRGYAYFLQEWGAHTWNAAIASPINSSDVSVATKTALAALDSGFFRVRYDRLTDREKDYMRAMAELGPGPHRSGEIAETLGITVQGAGPLRSGLIKKGMVYSPQHGDTAFTVPMFDEFMLRSMPDWKPRKKSTRRKTTRKRR